MSCHIKDTTMEHESSIVRCPRPIRGYIFSCGGRAVVHGPTSQAQVLTPPEVTTIIVASYEDINKARSIHCLSSYLLINI